MNGFLILKRLKLQNLKTLPIRISIRTSTTFVTASNLRLPLTSLQCGTILQALTNFKSLKQGQLLHAHSIICNTLQDNTYLRTKLAAFYANCGQMVEAQVIFNHVVLKNVFLWNSMIKGYARGCNFIKSIALYREMLCFGMNPDNFTYPFVLKACGDGGLVEIGRKVHCEVVVNGLVSDIYVGNCLLSMYSSFGDTEMMKTVFDRMPERDLTSWNAMISGYVKNSNARDALLVFQMMRKAAKEPTSTTLLGVVSACADLNILTEGKAVHGYIIRYNLAQLNCFLENACIEMYCRCNSMEIARLLFKELLWKDTVSWNSMISGYARNGDAFESLRLFCQMILEGVCPDPATIVAVLGACDQVMAMHFGLSIHSVIVKIGLAINVTVGTALMDMYSKCGCLLSSCHVFYEIPNKSSVSWSVMIAGYGFHGRGREAIALFQEMKECGMVPDEGVFTSLLSACSHAGLVREGKEIFCSMRNQHHIMPGVAHSSCLVDLLGRAGHLDEAYEFIKKMDIELNVDIWAALLSACHLHRNVELAELSAQKIFEMNPRAISSYVCLSNLYAAVKRWDDAERVRAMARGNGLKKAPGCSFVELDKVVHRFLVADKSHKQSKEIYSKLKELYHNLSEAGYKPDTSSVFYDVEEDVKVKMLWDHSERLAIAFALINTAPEMTIRITKNLRTCGDCHTVTKLISKLEDREIIMRDSRRFHHFKNGFCSCGDYW